MKNYCRLDHSKKQIIMDRTFAMKAEYTQSEEYAHLQQIRKDYPNYQVVRRTIKKNDNKKTYKGLTYDYMASYITRVDKDGSIMRDFEILRQECSYFQIKNWFMTLFPEINNFAA
jgi:hypothetical protein